MDDGREPEGDWKGTRHLILIFIRYRIRNRRQLYWSNLDSDPLDPAPQLGARPCRISWHVESMSGSTRWDKIEPLAHDQAESKLLHQFAAELLQMASYYGYVVLPSLGLLRTVLLESGILFAFLNVLCTMRGSNARM